MAGTNLSFPYDSEIFNYSWKNTPDIVLLNMLASGAVVFDAEIARMISNGSNFFTVPFYNEIGGDEGVYNGVNDIATTNLSGSTLSGVVFGRQKGWNAISFIKDFNSGADPMAQIVAGVARYWQKKRQTRLIGLLEALFAITGDADWSLHTTDIASAGKPQSEKFTVTGAPTTDGNCTVTVTAAGMTGSPKAVTVAILDADDAAGVATKIAAALNADTTVGAMFTATSNTADVIITKKVTAPFDTTLAMAFGAGTTGATASASVDNTEAVTIGDANLIGAATIENTCVKANGDHSDGYSLAIMHSVVANRLANLQLLEYKKYTDPSGITTQLPIGTINGKTVIINDNVPTYVSPVAGTTEYVTFILGTGAIAMADAPVAVPSEMDRDPAKYGGQDFIYTRIRECMHPYGFSFKGDATTDVGIPDSVLLASASWERKMPAKTILMAKLVTNG